MKLLITLLLGLLSAVVGDHRTHPVSEPHTLRSLNGVAYRKYQKGDDTSLLAKEDHLPSCGVFLCWVAVPSGTKTVIGVVNLEIPEDDTPQEIKTAIKDHRPKGSKSGEIGYIRLVYVLEAWRRQKIATTLLSVTFKEFPKTYPNWGVVYLLVLRTNQPARELYRKAGFINILDSPGDTHVIYARYNEG